MSVTKHDVVEGYFVDLNNRLTRDAVESSERDSARASYPEVVQGAGQIAVSQGVDLQS